MNLHHLSALIAFLVFPATAGFDDAWFLLTNEWYGADAYTDPAVLTNKANHCANAFSFHNPISSGMEQFVLKNKLHLELQIFGSTAADGLSAAYIESQRSELARFAPIATEAGVRVLWNPMPEWDQSGGRWANPRPHYTGMTRKQAYSAFRNHYMGGTHAPLNTYLAQTPLQRGVMLAAGQTDFPCNTAYAYEMGVDMVICERSIDELGDLSTGIAFVRGLSRQYDRNWGIDLSTWRTANDRATSFDASGRLIGGWSPSYCRRHMYISYLCGANLFQIEASAYYSGSTLNPFGQAVSEFGNFSLVRHPDPGRPVVNMALMMDFYNGFDAKHWIWGPAQDAVWYSEIPYSDGDYMIDNFLRIAYPEHWLHGTTPGRNWVSASGMNAAGFQAYLEGGGDARPYEPMGQTRYGDNLDIIYDNAPARALAKYKIIALLGGVVITDTLRARLQTWVAAGGILVVNARQVTSADQELLGVTLSAATATASAGKWISDQVVTAEPSFTYTRVTPVTAKIIAASNTGDALITANTIGAGQVIFTAPHYLQSTAKDTLLNIAVKLFDTLDARYALARISGPPVEYIINQDTGRIIVTLVNNTGVAWNGSVIFTTVPSGNFAVREWTGDHVLSHSVTGGNVAVTLSVPAWDLRIAALEFTANSGAQTGHQTTVAAPEFVYGEGRIYLPVSGRYSIRAVDIRGRMVFNRTSWDERGWSQIKTGPGAKIISVKGPGFSAVRKLVTGE